MTKFIKIDGGIGRCIAATGAVKQFCEKEKDTVVISSFTFAFDGIGIDRVYPLNTPYLYEDHIIKGEYLEPEPYNSSKFYREEMHITQVFNDILNGSEEYIAPTMKLTPMERATAKTYVMGLKDKHKKKILLLQPYGASGGTPNPDESYRSFTDEAVSEIVDAYKDEYTILLIRSQNQATCSDTIPITEQNLRRLFAVIPYADGAICCDSFLHHAIAALGNPIPTVVLWGGTSEKNFGYEGQVNLRKKEIGLVEPNRIPHAHNYYVTKNEGCNDFTGMVEQIKKTITIDKKETKKTKEA